MSSATLVKLKLTLHDLQTLRLFLRSPRDKDGWGDISAPIMIQVIERMSRSDLVEIERYSDGSGRGRLTPRAQTLVEFLA